MFCVQIIVFTATVDNSAIVLCCFGVYCVYSNSRFSAMVLCCVGVYCGYIKCIYSAKVLCCLWNLLWLQHQMIYCNGTVLCVEFIVVTTTEDIVQWYCVVCGDCCD